MLVLYIIVHYNTVKVVAVVLSSNVAIEVSNSSGVSIELYYIVSHVSNWCCTVNSVSSRIVL